jgi:hypothetical protein
MIQNKWLAFPLLFARPTVQARRKQEEGNEQAEKSTTVLKQYEQLMSHAVVMMIYQNGWK